MLFLCPSAYAESSVTLFGVVDAGLGYSSNLASVLSAGQRGVPAVYSGKPAFIFTSGTSLGSRWGLTGREDLGQGLSAVFWLQNGFDVGTGKLNQGGREFGMQSWVGLDSTRYGKLTLGRQYDPIVDFVGSIGPSSFLTGMAAHPGDLDNIDNQSRESNSIKYTTPNFSGFQFGALYGFGGQAGSVISQSTWSLGGKYVRGPIAIGAAYLLAHNSNAINGSGWNNAYDGTFSSSINVGFQSAKTMQIVAAALSYQLSAVTLGVSYSNTEYQAGNFSLFKNNVDFNSGGITAVWQISPALRVGTGYSYTRGNSIAASRAPSYSQVNLSSFYSLSKRTLLYGLIGYQRANGNTLDAYGNIVPATASIGDVSNGSSSAGPTQVLVRVGMRQMF
ncbi:porin [Paraburkholderia fungorum]|uniref:Porin n=2 Tax=Paraburkholderia fungorum TaxID=134537 RepID=A0A3R7HKF7_9BURK|nr:porin [Paraburkholderia fungorum]RKF50121.1 porin [Paraburkholderia fungorum]